MRRTKGEGSIYKDEAKGLYVFQFTYVDKTTNKQCRKKLYGKTKKAVKQAQEAFLEELEKHYKEYFGNAASLDVVVGQDIKATSNLSKWLYYWLDNVKKQSIAVKTYERYRSYVSCHLDNSIGQQAINTISPFQFQEFFKELRLHGGKNHQGIAPRTINSIRQMLKQSFTDAINFGLLVKNPLTSTKALSTEPTRMHVITKEQANKLISVALRHSRFQWIIIVLALETGMRIGEIFGLEWSNINFEKKTLLVEKTVVSTTKGKLIKPIGKNKFSRRTINLSDHTIESLKRFKLWLKAASIRTGYSYDKSNWLLPNPKGEPRSPNSFTSHKFKDLLAEAGIDNAFRVHDMRHTHATLLLEAGVNVKVVSERLGHASTRITLDLYAHVLKTMQAAAVDALNKMF